MMITCSKFAKTVESLLAGDADRPALASLTGHGNRCHACSVIWERARQIVGALEVVAVETTALVSDESIRATRERLRTAFSRANVPPVIFSSIRSSAGIIFFGVSDQGLCDVALGLNREDDYRARLASRAPEIWRDDKKLRPVRRELEAYFAGKLKSFSISTDLRSVTPFVAQVLRATRKVRFGSLTTYGALARRLGMPGASRAVGTALSRNPVPIVIPCHRVVQRTGGVGGYIGGQRLKRSLLQLEGHRLAERGKLPLSRVS